MNYKKLNDVAYYSDLRTKDITIENYITTENMLPNIGGICMASAVPSCRTAKYYEKNDILSAYQTLNILGIAKQQDQSRHEENGG